MHVLLILVVVSSVLSSSKPEPDPLVAHYPAAPIDYCTNGGVCVPPVICSVHYLQALYDPSSACFVAEGTPGLCCPPISKRPCEYARCFNSTNAYFFVLRLEKATVEEGTKPTRVKVSAKV